MLVHIQAVILCRIDSFLFSSHSVWKTLIKRKSEAQSHFLYNKEQQNNKVQFELRYTGVSSTESLINYFKSKHRIHVIH